MTAKDIYAEGFHDGRDNRDSRWVDDEKRWRASDACKAGAVVLTPDELRELAAKAYKDGMRHIMCGYDCDEAHEAVEALIEEAADG